MKWLLVTAAIAASSGLSAQEPPTPPTQQTPPTTEAPPTTKKPAVAPTKVVDERAQTMRDHIEAGRPLKSHVRVAVRLKNGNKLQGVVKDGRLVERVDGLRFVDAQAREPGAGIRLWYSSGVRNYVFVPFQQFAEYEVLQRLSQKDLEQMEQELQREEVRRAAEREAGAAPAVPPVEGQEGAPPAPTAEQAKESSATGETKGTKTDKDTGKKETAPAGTAAAEAEQRKAWFALVSAYPPTAGWGASKRDEIARRKAVIGATPSESELHFVEKFAEWQKACAFFGTESTAKPAAEGQGGAAEPSGRHVRKKG